MLEPELGGAEKSGIGAANLGAPRAIPPRCPPLASARPLPIMPLPDPGAPNGLLGAAPKGFEVD